MKHERHRNEVELGCSCGCCESHHKNKGEKGVFLKDYGFELIKIVMSTALVVLCVCVEFSYIVNLLTLLCATLICGSNLILGFIKSLAKKRFFTEQTLMLIAVTVAFILGEFIESVMITVLFSSGELLEKIATDNSRKKVSMIGELKVSVAHLISSAGITDVTPEYVTAGSLVEVKKGEKIPFDGVLVGADAVLDLKSITGESRLYTVKNGDGVFGGSINAGNPIVIRTTKEYKDSTAEKITELVEHSLERKAKSQKFITKFAKIYTPIVAILAVVIAVVVPLFDGLNFTKWIYKGLSFLVISCPCALVISVPLAFFSGIGGLARKGVLVKGGNYLDALSSVKTVIFDKTGTITEGKFTVEKVVAFNGFSEEEVLDYASIIERKSNHPIAKSIVEYISGKGDNFEKEISGIEEISGLGIKAKIDGKDILVGNKKLLKKHKIKLGAIERENDSVFLSICGVLVGQIIMVDKIKNSSISAIEKLKNCGVKRIIALSGDEEKTVREVCEKTGITEYKWGLLPKEKTNELKTIKSQEKDKILFVGDGVNDAPILAEADVGVAMGKIGSELAVETADAVIMDDDLSRVSTAIKGAKKVKRTVIINIVFSLAVKLAVMVLSIVISLPVYVAMIADVGVMLLAVLNSLTCYFVKD